MRMIVRQIFITFFFEAGEALVVLVFPNTTISSSQTSSSPAFSPPPRSPPALSASSAVPQRRSCGKQVLSCQSGGQARAGADRPKPVRADPQPAAHIHTVYVTPAAFAQQLRSPTAERRRGEAGRCPPLAFRSLPRPSQESYGETGGDAMRT